MSEQIRTICLMKLSYSCVVCSVCEYVCRIEPMLLKILVRSGSAWRFRSSLILASIFPQSLLKSEPPTSPVLNPAALPPENRSAYLFCRFVL